MKRLKKFVALFTLAAVCLAVPGLGKMTAKAAEPTTYVLNYSESHGEWRFKLASSWSEEVQDRELYYLQQDIKDGDYIVIDNDTDCNPLNLNVSVRLGNLTVKAAVKTPVVYAKGYDGVFVLDGTTAAVNGDVSHAYVYGGARANFNNNVDTLEMIGLSNDKSNNLHAYINCAGTVNHLIAKDNRDQSTFYEAYSFASGKLVIEDGSLRTEDQYYSKTASAAPAQTPAPAATEQPAQAAAAPSQNTASSEYDDVPKTGESPVMFWLLSAAVVCLAGGYTLRKKSVQ